MAKPPECSCKQHASFANDKDLKLFKRSARKISKELADILVQKGFLSERAVYLCTACADYAYDNFVVSPKEKRPKYSPHYIDTVIEFIETNVIDDVDLIKILKSIGNKKHADLVTDSKNESKKYKDDAFLENYDPCEWLQNQNVLVVEFLKALCGIGDFSLNRKKTLSFAKLFEQLLLCCSDNVILPLSFTANLIGYFSTGSKTLSEISNAVSPSGSYSTIMNWINDRSSVKNDLPDINDVFTFFDNNQVLARNWRVTFDYKSTASVITNILHVFPNTVTSYQNNPELSPSSWLYNNTRSENVVLVRNLQTKCDNLFREYRINFMSQQLDKVFIETDFTCKPEKSADKYCFISDTCATKPSCVILGDPLMENPCSYRAVESVLDTIVTSACKNRQWTIAGCDGSPYILGSRLIDRSYICRFCHIEINGQSALENHLKVNHVDTDIESELKLCKKYGNLLLIPGLGHIEINMVKGIFKLLWPLYFKELALMLGFRTIRAQTCCQKATDHHKTMQMLEIALFALADELVLHYSNTCKERKIDPTVQGYVTFLASVKNENFLFAYEVAFTYMLSIYLFRAAVRRNNAPLILATRVKFAPLFFALNQTNYQELHIRDCLMRVIMPDEIHKLVTNNESFSCSGHPSKGEEGDFILEAKNRRTKLWMPPGTPTEKRWYRVCRNQDRLEKMKDDLSQMLGMVQSDDLYHYDLTEEIVQFRRKTRSFGVFNDPLEQRPLTCLNGHDVDHNLINFSVHAKENLEKYLEVYESDSTFGKGPVKLQPVFVLPTDRDTYFDITKKSKSTLEK